MATTTTLFEPFLELNLSQTNSQAYGSMMALNSEVAELSRNEAIRSSQ
jgi:hypothetical protein